MQNYRLSQHEVTLWLKYIEHQIGFVLPKSQTHWIQGVIERQMQQCRQSSTEILTAIVHDARLYHQLMDEVLIPRTEFFRHLPTFEFIEAYAAAWQYQLNQTLDEVDKYKKTNITLPNSLQRNVGFKAWSVGCSSGQEAVSIALSLNHVLVDGQSFTVFGSDFHQKALSQAQLGQYDRSELVCIPNKYYGQLKSFGEQSFGLHTALQSRLQYFSKNLIDRQQLIPLQLGECQLIVCQNVLIYFRQFEQRDIVQLMSQYLADDGVLLLTAGQTAQVNEASLLPLQLPMIHGYCKTTAPTWLKHLGKLL